MNFRYAHYEAIHFPGMYAILYAVIDGQPSEIRHDWTISQCRSYAQGGGFVAERTRTEDGLTVFEFHKPEGSVA